MSRMGEVVSFEGNSSAAIVEEALKFIGEKVKADRPFLTVIWDGSPHSPWVASDEDRKPFASLDSKCQHHYGELVAFDRAVGALRKGLRELDAAENTIVWYCSDNGGLGGIKPDSVGGLRGNKSSVWEGGLRVPCVIEWPAAIQPRVSGHPASTMDIFPTIAGQDYPEGKVNPGEPAPSFWRDAEACKPFLTEWAKRPEYAGRLNRKKGKKQRKAKPRK